MLAADEGGGRQGQSGREDREVGLARAESETETRAKPTIQSVVGKSDEGDCQSGKSSWRREGLGLILLIKNDDGRGCYSDSGLLVTHGAEPRPPGVPGPSQQDLPPPCLCPVFLRRISPGGRVPRSPVLTLCGAHLGGFFL